jgi:hypothetical protein
MNFAQNDLQFQNQKQFDVNQADQNPDQQKQLQMMQQA